MDEAALWDLIIAGHDQMTIPQKNLWEMIRINPEKWTQKRYGASSGGFWAVALIGQSVIWRNHIEHGFNRSPFARYGEILEFGCNQDGLDVAMQYLLNELADGYPSAPRSSPPRHGEYSGDPRRT